MAATNLFEETLQAWTYTRDGVLAELRNIPASQYSFRPSEHSRTVAELAQHLIESGLMAAGELSRPDGNFQRQSYPEFLREYAGTRARSTNRDALLELLESTQQEGLRKLRAAGEDAMMQPIVQFNGVPAMRLTWLNHAIAHEEYHRGQLALYARLLGRIPALTQLIEGSGPEE
jgi:uncharacterized damage-inducible protein DinB